MSIMIGLFLLEVFLARKSKKRYLAIVDSRFRSFPRESSHYIPNKSICGGSIDKVFGNLWAAGTSEDVAFVVVCSAESIA